MNENELLEKGYKIYPPTVIDSPNMQRLFQKRVKDCNGDTLYFIDIKEYGGTETRYEYEIYLYQNRTHKPLKLLFYNGWSLDDVEMYANLIYTDMGDRTLFEPYETSE